jgi:hypothetical protein
MQKTFRFYTTPSEREYSPRFRDYRLYSEHCITLCYKGVAKFFRCSVSDLKPVIWVTLSDREIKGGFPVKIYGNNLHFYDDEMGKNRRIVLADTSVGFFRRECRLSDGNEYYVRVMEEVSDEFSN